jgi:HAMP domain-containing protein
MAIKKRFGTRGLGLAQMPTKTSINLVTVGQKKLDPRIAVPALIILLAVLCIFTKFLVIDRFGEVAAAQQEVSALQARLDADYAELAGFEDLNDRYAHYTYSGFTEEELTRTSRVEVLRLIRRVVLPNVTVNAWSLSSNELILDITGNSLQEINLLAQAVQGNSMVNYCTVSTANTNEQRAAEALNGAVSARMLIYLESQAHE